MLARNSDLYLEVRASCVAFSSSAWRACSTSAFLRSTSAFCCARRRAFSCSAAVGAAAGDLQGRLQRARVHQVEDAVLRADDGCQLGEDHLRDREEVALALEHAGELGEVCLEPVLLRVLEGRVLQVTDHLVDVV